MQLFSNKIVLSKVQAATCDLPHENRSAEPMTLAASIYAITSVIIVFRLISKIWVSRTMGPDDWIVIIAQVSLVLAHTACPMCQCLQIILFISTYFTIKSKIFHSPD